jgi:DNA-binding CsgD family transcriptional regulator
MPRIRLSRAQWKNHVERWLASGLTTQEFADREGLSRKKLTRWKRIFSRMDAEKEKFSNQSHQVSPAISFIALHPHSVTEERKSSTCFEVVLGASKMVRVPADFDNESLARLLDVLDGGKR